ncbi:hypothetical protein HanHA300_Chr04g0128711 [Helianthus annuus]|nr:hypothetical protein HanHA300_Chr04g0128711 [Helianthus annuus]
MESGLRSLKKFGILPLNRLFERSKISSDCDLDRDAGIGPSKLFLLRFKEICKLGGRDLITPLSLFFPS